MSLSATDCHVLWKYLAYGLVLNDNKVVNGSDDEIDIESDEVSMNYFLLFMLYILLKERSKHCVI